MPNLKPRGAKEQLLWLGWLLVIATWLVQPLLVPNKMLPTISDSQLILGITFVVAGYAATLWCYAAMGNAWRIGVDQREKNALVTSGPYRFIRHPIYSFQLVMLAGALLLLPTALSLVALAVHAVCAIIKASGEEKYLLTVHGEDYRAYLKRSGGLFPKIF
jgi:protein-S-isoprenylcysteine O-methyltransferase Ste14